MTGRPQMAFSDFVPRRFQAPFKAWQTPHAPGQYLMLLRRNQRRSRRFGPRLSALIVS